MSLVELLTNERIALSATVASKKRALELSSQLLASHQANLVQNEIFDSLLSRERLGSTGLGGGVAIPHGRVAGIDKAVAAFIQLKEGVDFDAIDQQPVDLVFALLVPQEATDEHLQILATLAEAFKRPELRQALRQAKDIETLLTLLSNGSNSGGASEVYSSAI